VRSGEPRVTVVVPYGDRPICPCGKVVYASRAEASAAIRELGSAMRAYACPLGNRAYHLTGSRRRRARV
jgi:hypothetical protein